MKTTQALLLGLATLMVLASCSSPPPAPINRCPASLKGVPSASDAVINWGEDPPKVMALIESVALECIPVFHPARTTDKAKHGAYSEYQIAATANIGYQIRDAEFFVRSTRFRDLEGTVLFEALSPSGVVLGSGEGTIRIVQGGHAAKASATIIGLSDQVIGRVATVVAYIPHST